MGFNFKTLKSTPVKGGGGKMVGKTGSNPSKPNQMVNKGGMSKGMLKGGSGKMFGFSGSKPSKKQ
jgi:hypothetical protein